MQDLESVEIQENIPKYPVLILTCMDPRIDIYRIFQLNPGDVFILRNAGNIYTQDVLRSILITIFKYEIKYIIILGHLDCGMTKINPVELRKKLPSEFLSRLSSNYSELFSELINFFKPFENEVSDEVLFDKPGILAMANSGPDTNKSQFFITTKEAPSLNRKYTIFGEVVEGLDEVWEWAAAGSAATVSD